MAREPTKLPTAGTRATPKAQDLGYPDSSVTVTRMQRVVGNPFWRMQNGDAWIECDSDTLIANPSDHR